MSQYDWLKGSHMTKVHVLWLPNETDYSYCELVAPIAQLHCRQTERQDSWTSYPFHSPMISVLLWKWALIV